MPPSRNLGKGTPGTVWIAAIPALFVLSSLLIAQNVPPEFPSASARQCSISAVSTHCHTRRFESDGSQWTAPVRTSVILPSTERQNWTLIPQLLPAIQTKGLHFNRPPPILAALPIGNRPRTSSSALATVVAMTVKGLILKARPRDRWIVRTLKSRLMGRSWSMWLDFTRGQKASGINLMIRDLICLPECILWREG